MDQNCLLKHYGENEFSYFSRMFLTSLFMQV